MDNPIIQAGLQDPAMLKEMNALADVRMTPDIVHAIHQACIDDGRPQAIAYANAVHGLREASELSASEASAVKSFNSSSALSDSFKSPNVTISYRDCVNRDGQEFIVTFVRPVLQHAHTRKAPLS